MVVTTQSGSRYIFTEKGNETHFVNGSKEGIVHSIKGLKIGQSLEIYFYPLSAYDFQKSEELSFAKSTPIVSIR